MACKNIVFSWTAVQKDWSFFTFEGFNYLQLEFQGHLGNAINFNQESKFVIQPNYSRLSDSVFLFIINWLWLLIIK